MNNKMDNKELNKITLESTKSILTNSSENEFRILLKGTVKEWDDTVYKTVFEAVYNIFKKIRIMEFEMDAETGEILSCKEIEVK